MEIESISNDVWDRLESGERLTPEQERVIMAHIKSGDFKDVPSIVNKLRENSQYLKEKSVENMAKVVDNLKNYMIYDINQTFEKAIVCEWKGAATNAQANRLENIMIQKKDVIEEQRVHEEALKNAQESIKAAETAQRIAQDQARAQEQARVQKALEAAKAVQEKEQQKRAEAEAQARARAMAQRAQEEARAQEIQRRLNQNPPPRDRVGQGAIDGAKTATTPQRPGSISDYINRR